MCFTSVHFVACLNITCELQMPCTIKLFSLASSFSKVTNSERHHDPSRHIPMLTWWDPQPSMMLEATRGGTEKLRPWLCSAAIKMDLNIFTSKMGLMKASAVFFTVLLKGLR